MKKIIPVLLVVLVGFGLFYFLKTDRGRSGMVEGEVSEEPQVDIRVEEYVVQDNDTFTTVMDSLGIGYADALAIVDAAVEVVDFTSIKVGKSFRLVFEDGVKKRIEYEPGTEDVIIVDLENSFATHKEPIQYDISIESVQVTIDESLFLSGLDVGLSEVLLLEYVEVFAWEVDFATQVQSGDSFNIVYEKRSRNGIDAGVGDVIFGSFFSDRGESFAYRFIEPDGSRSYYDEEGSSLVRAFLKAPLNYSRITSGYTNARFHPVLQSTTPHRAIDYAAATGTPVKAVADGTVSFAAWNGGYGNYVDIRHGSVYQTQYAHLSSILVSPGESVKQGDIIGKVGSTGFSTGPHLHYQVKVHGELMNPGEVEFPKGDSISDELMEEFYRQKDEVDRLR